MTHSRYFQYPHIPKEQGLSMYRFAETRVIWCRASTRIGLFPLAYNADKDGSEADLLN